MRDAEERGERVPQEQKTAITSLIQGTFGSEIGQKMLEHLDKVFVQRPMYVKGMTLEEVAYRQGQQDLIDQLKKELK